MCYALWNEHLATMDASDDRRERVVHGGLAAVFALVAVLAIIDVVGDLRVGTTAAHVVVESAIAALGAIGAGVLLARLGRLRREAQQLRDEARTLTTNLDASRAEAARWRRDASDLIAGLATAIDRQLEAWGLTTAEKEVALLLLKGLSHKEIAAVREVSETTVRQQARAIYRKASVEGRHDLAAFFLEDLLDARTPSAERA